MVKVTFRCNYDFLDVREVKVPITINLESAIAEAKRFISEKAFHADMIDIQIINT